MAAARRTNSARSGSSCAWAADVTTNRVRADAMRVGRSILRQLLHRRGEVREAGWTEGRAGKAASSIPDRSERVNVRVRRDRALEPEILRAQNRGKCKRQMWIPAASHATSTPGSFQNATVRPSRAPSGYANS